MNIKKNVLIIILSLISLNSYATENKKTNYEVTRSAIINLCHDFGDVVYTDIEKKSTCLKLLKSGLSLNIEISVNILGKSLINGINLKKNEIVGKRILEKSQKT